MPLNGLDAAMAFRLRRRDQPGAGTDGLHRVAAFT